MDVALAWVRLPGFPMEFWNLVSFRDVGNALGEFIDADMSFLTTKKYVCRKNPSILKHQKRPQARFSMVWGQLVRKQRLDYEGIPFICHRCLVYGHIAKHCNLPFA